MKVIRVLVGILGLGSFLIGCVFSLSPNAGEHTIGRTLVQGGAMLIAGLLISLAILEKKDRK
ncbi:MAG: hypothetical protein M3367_01645 [Acidobacteriota bacterium]|nr:hypothetical protein [Acidobacteriota bacterium]